jgi:hypothetical protein
MAEKGGFSSSFFGGLFGAVAGIIFIGMIFEKKTPASKNSGEKPPCAGGKGEEAVVINPEETQR